MSGQGYRSYMICTAPRSGSTLLCKLLAATKVAGVPGSHFHVPSLDGWLADYDLVEADFPSRRDLLRAIFDAARARGMGETDLFGLRMQRGSFDHFMQQLDVLRPGRVGDVDRLKAEFGPTLFVHLSRPDRLDQAISRLRAEQTGLWHRWADGTELERTAPPREACYDAEAIARHMSALSSLDEAWERWFEREKLQPLRISYDALSEDPQKVLAEILSSLGLDPLIARTIETPTAKLADAESRQWRERFEAENGPT
ncbi:Stf0 family sulfotransferase [Hoeflea poritis]|uniref:Stf0 family sulfotransferase n=1 Tax=Hoeflea poritis TaxID=2993659 RepID=A0ABT4VM61_9HYPH|nr:Stf0 family sulfotransferase [Hoeflea poritis]MDA4845756.1 Stf0 family sulfotransferase [Hoeflea poritis]